MTSQCHIIDKLNFLIDTDPTVIDPADNNIYHQVSVFLLPQIEEVFDSPYFQDYEIKIDSLILDIGIVAISDGSWYEVGAKLRKFLYDELYKRVENVKSNPSAIEMVIPRKKAEVMNLFMFLKSGLLYGNYFGNPEDLLEEILEKDISVLISFLKENAGNQNIVRRLIWEFKPDLVELVILSLVSVEKDFMKNFLSVIKNKQSLIGHTQKRNDLETDVIKYHRQILEFTLNYCLLEKSVQFNRIDFVQSLITRISNHYDISFDLILFALIENLEKTDVDSRQKFELKNLLFEILKKNKSNILKKKETRKPYSDYAYQFLKAVESGSSSENLGELWNILSEFPKPLKELLFTNCQSMRMIRNMVLLFSNQIYTKCIKLLCITKFEYVEQILLITEKYITEVPSKHAPFYISVNNHSRYLREFVLKYFLSQRDGLFSEKAFTRTILQDIANHHNLSYCSLLINIFDYIAQSIKDKNTYSTLISNLTELLNEDSESENNRLLPSRNYTEETSILKLYENLLCFLFEGISGIEGNEFIDAHNLQLKINKIRLKRPDLINILFLMLKKDQEKIDRISRLHSSDVLLTLLKSYVNIFFSPADKNISEDNNVIDLLECIHKAQFNQQEFYLQLFKKSLLIELGKAESSQTLYHLIKNQIEMVNERVACAINHHEQLPLNQCSSLSEINGISEELDYDNLVPDQLLKYLYYFINNPHVYEMHGLKRERVLTILQEKHCNLFLKELMNMLFHKPEICKNLDTSCFLFNETTLQLLMKTDDVWNSIEDYIQREIPVSKQHTITDYPSYGLIFSIYKLIQKARQTVSASLESHQFNNESVTDKIEKNNQNRVQAILDELSRYLQGKDTGNYSDDITHRMAFEEIIIGNPQELRHWLVRISRQPDVLEKVTSLLSEKMFFRLLHVLDSNTGMTAYKFYKIFNERIYSILSGLEIDRHSRYIKTVLIEILLGERIYHTVIIDIINEVIRRYKVTFSTNDVISSSKTVIDELLKIESDFKEEESKSEKPFHADIKCDYIIPTGDSHIVDESNNESFEHAINEIQIQQISILNAGIVLGAAYFEKLFNMLDFTRDKHFTGEYSVQKALKVLNYFASGTVDCHEYELTLAKVLCGLKLDHPVDSSVELNDNEKEMVESLVDAIIKNWKIMKNTSRNSFRESFLIRKGYLTESDDEWLLRVEKRAFDMLIDTLPWGFSMVKFPWMEKLLKVEWNWK